MQSDRRLEVLELRDNYVAKHKYNVDALMAGMRGLLEKLYMGPNVYRALDTILSLKEHMHDHPERRVAELANIEETKPTWMKDAAKLRHEQNAQ
eukprot:1419462-Rhodomonas_salina.1